MGKEDYLMFCITREAYLYLTLNIGECEDTPASVAKGNFDKQNIKFKNILEQNLQLTQAIILDQD